MMYYDDGMGQTFVYIESLGPVAIVRALTWEEAWDCVTDEILPDAHPEDVTENEHGELPEGLYWRGTPGDGLGPVGRADMNTSLLVPLCTKRCELLGIDPMEIPWVLGALTGED